MAALILEISTRGLHRYQQINEEITTVGRALDNDIILSDPTVAPHHLKIIRHGDDSLEIVNLTDVNPTRVDHQKLASLVTRDLPVCLEIGRIEARILPRNFAVAATRPLAGRDRRGHLFGHASWSVALVLACLLVSGLDFYLGSYTSFKWGDLFKIVLRETVLTIGAFVLVLAVLERLLVNRWEIRQLVTSVCLVYLCHYLAANAADGLDYLFSASWPTTLFQFGWYLVVIPAAIALYLVNISHLKPGRSAILALLISSPIAVPAIMQSPALYALLDDFSPTARYHNNLSPFNLHLARTVTIDRFIAQAQNLEAGEFAD